MADIDDLKVRAADALGALRLAQIALGHLGLPENPRTATTIPLVLASMDMAAAAYALLVNQPERAWVAALALQRIQMEHVLRGAFFAKAATDAELDRFRRTGRMPRRGKRQIYLQELAEESAEHLKWDKSRLSPVVKNHHDDLSGLVHGGREVLAVYMQHEEWGDITVDWDELGGHVGDILVFAQLALGVAAFLSPLDGERLDRACRPAVEAAHAFFESKR